LRLHDLFKQPLSLKLRVINTDRNPAYGEAIRKMRAAQILDDSVDHRQVKYLNNRLKADYSAIKRRIRSMLGFKSAKTA
jgi:transposase, IS6 family